MSLRPWTFFETQHPCGFPEGFHSLYLLYSYKRYIRGVFDPPNRVALRAPSTPPLLASAFGLASWRATRLRLGLGYASDSSPFGFVGPVKNARPWERYRAIYPLDGRRGEVVAQRSCLFLPWTSRPYVWTYGQRCALTTCPHYGAHLPTAVQPTA